MSLGQLALHVANMPGGVAEFINEPIAKAPTVPMPEPASVQEILAALEWSTATVMDKLRM